MKQARRKISVLIAIIMIFCMSLGSTSFAVSGNLQSEVIIDFYEYEGVIDIDLSDYITADEEVVLEEISPEANNITAKSADFGEPLNTQSINPMGFSAMSSSSSYQIFTDNGTLNGVGDYFESIIYFVDPGQMIEARLPQTSFGLTLDLFRYNFSTGGWDLVDYSDFGNITAETVGMVNNTSSWQAYVVYIESYVSGSRSYNLTVVINDSYSVNEHNNSRFHANGYTVANLTNTQYYTLSGALHSQIDADWSRFIVPTTANYSKLYFTEYNTANVNYEVFRLVSGSMVKQTKDSDGGYLVVKGVDYFLRVTFKNPGTTISSFINYNFELRTQLQPPPPPQTTSVQLRYTVNHAAVPTQNYSTGGLRLALLQNATFHGYVDYYTAAGTLNTSENDRITVRIVNSAWNVGAPSHTMEGYGLAASNGTASATTGIGMVYGQGTGVNMRYDYSVTLNVISDNYGVLASFPVFVTNRIMP